MDTLEFGKFQDIPLSDEFFDSLKKDYKDFANWYVRKVSENASAYIQKTNGKLTGFMYLKVEDGEVTDVIPMLEPKPRIKIGTFKVEAHGTKLGERLIKKAFDYAIVKNYEELYITVFPKHRNLISLLEEFGFVHIGEKKTDDGIENVFIKSLSHERISGNLRSDYPLIDTRNVKYYLLGIYPKWHSQLFPDSILNTETYDLLSDTSYTNSISKTYVSWIADIKKIKKGDILIIYRTKEEGKAAEYSSVATSICVAEEIRLKADFNNVDDYINYAQPFSVFDSKELKKWWIHTNLSVIKMLYNGALTKRLIRKTLMDDVGLDRESYSGFRGITKQQLLRISELGGVSERLIVC